ncbi:ATP-binding protein [Streptomyces macrosporus]|uniref:Histidine kinase/HSP90-like ATPase domain-containing protein n=1 Tax=Streptomyces macrosporus TaxID=44032 RepID=A0ABN3KJ84_9ACTN
MNAAEIRRPARSARQGAAPTRSLTWPLPCTADAPARARRLTRKLLHDWGLGDEYTCRAEAVVAELVGNALTHARPDIHITWRLVRDTEQPSVRVEVTDGGPAPSPADADYDPDEHGRGHLIVTALASRWGTAPRKGRHGCTRWAQITPR